MPASSPIHRTVHSILILPFKGDSIGVAGVLIAGDALQKTRNGGLRSSVQRATAKLLEVARDEGVSLACTHRNNACHGASQNIRESSPRSVATRRSD